MLAETIDGEQGLVDAHGAAALLHTSIWTVYRLVRRGELRAYQIGGRLRFERDDVLRSIKILNPSK